MFKKPTKEQRQRLREWRAERRTSLRKRAADDTRLACYLFVGGSDGRLTPKEIRIVEQEFETSRFQPLPSLELLSRKVRSFLTSCAPSLHERRQLLTQLRHFALCDGDISVEEESALLTIEGLLRVSPESRKAARKSWRPIAGTAKEEKQSKGTARPQSTRDGHQWNRRREDTPQPKAPTTHWSYEYLGCTEQDDDETIKKCYRRLAVKLHPDKHAARSTTPEETLKHIQAFQKLQEAYDAILKLRRIPPTRGRANPQARP